VSKQKPIRVEPGCPPIVSHKPARASKRRATAFSPPAVFSISSGTPLESFSRVPAQRANPASIPSSAYPGWTITASAPTSAAASQVCWRIFRDP
jgi:hypothetical protein